MDFWHEMRMPPRLTSWDGGERRVGVELEFAAVSAQAGAQLVQELFGGSIEEEDPHRYHIVETELGKFTSELDTQYAHRSYGEIDEVSDGGDPFAQFLIDFRDGIRRAYGNISSLVVPCEIVCPPIALRILPELDSLVRKLTEAGAQGTRIRASGD